MTKYEKAMAQVTDWIKIAEQDGDMPLAHNLKHAKEVLGGYSKLSSDDAPHNVQVLKQYNALVSMAMRHSNMAK